jgi:transposase
MRGRHKTYTIELSEREYQHLRHIAASYTRPYREVQRAKTILCYAEHPDWTDDQVAQAVAASPRTVRTWRRRWQEQQTLDDSPRSGRPRVFSP